MIGVAITFIGLLVILFTSLIFVGKRIYKAKLKEDYFLRSNAPFELIKISNIELPILFLLIGFVTTGVACCSGFLWVRFYMSSSYQTPLFIIGSFMFLTILGMFFFDFTNYKTHFLFFILSVASSVVFATFMGSMFFAFKVINETLSYIFAIISFVIALGIVCLILNPKFGSWSKLEKVEVDGTIQYIRPKRYVVAYTEWILMSLDILLVAIGLIGYFIFYLV